MNEREAAIAHVTVGRRHAEVTRVCVIERGAGFPAAFTIPGLTLALDDASVRVAIDAGEVRSARVAIRGEAHGQPHTLGESDVRAAERAFEVARAGVASTERQIARLAGIGLRERPPGSKSAGPARAPITARLELAALLRTRSMWLTDRLIARTRVRDEAEERLREAREAFARASTDRPRRADELGKAIDVELDCSGVEAASVRVSVSYVVPGARWMPAYTLRLEDGKARLQVRALVQQKTGEDWSGVRLRLSTAERMRWSDLPELSSLRIGRAQAAPPRRGFRPAPVGADTLFADYDRALPKAAPVDTGVLDAREVDALAKESRSDESIIDPMPRAISPMGSAGYGGAPGGGPADTLPATSIGTVLAAPAPSASPQSFMVAMRSMPPPARKSRGLLGGAVESAGSMLQTEREATSGARGRRAKREEPAAHAAVAIDASSLAYGRMRMAGPTDARRGELATVSEIDLYVEASVSVGIALRGQLPSLLESARRAAEDLDASARPPRFSAPEPNDGFDFAFDTDAPVDVLSDGQGHAISVTHLEASARLFHVTVPRESRDVFRCAEVTSPLDAPLLAGPLDVYEGGDFLLSGELATTAPRGKLTVGLGVDPAVKVARNTRFAETVTGLMRGALELRHEVTLDVQNQRKTAIELEVRERIPTTRDKEEEIKVDVVTVSPPWGEYDPDDAHLLGGHLWRVELGAGEKRKLHVEYVVRIAAKHELVGGNRRES